MATPYQTPGVYIEEKNVFPGSAVAVETAVPVFIGYTQKAERNSKSLIGEPVRVTSFAEYIEMFGQGYHHQFELAVKRIDQFDSSLILNPGGEAATSTHGTGNMFYFYNCIRFFYQNGGSNCYIVSLGIYGGDNAIAAKVDKADFIKQDVFAKLEKEFEPTMVVIPDFVINRNDCYELYAEVLKHCQRTQSRIGIFDVIPDVADKNNEETFEVFRNAIGLEGLNYGAAYYPWLNTSIVDASEINFTNLTVTPADLKIILPEPGISTAIDKWAEANKTQVAAQETAQEKNNRNSMLHQSLVVLSTTYVQLMAEIKNRLNLLPPSAAMAGIYSLVDSSRGVWKAPANVAVSMVNAPAVNISAAEQEQMNVDAITGKSINAIRPFPGIGTLVWGARTLDGNSQDWRYINVRRTMIMIEQSLKLACRAYVFEPNDAGTWTTIKSMINNFLNNLWKQGALAGAVPEQAFDVQVGLGATMTPTDILDGLLKITVKLAIVRPAEFIVITFQQQQQQH
jgi:uncharacterized protein